ncbi:MAG: winged helix-turn-helix domain-containing protein [Burkholderiaceae bacterium]|nr:winged helix-turn-helix domain-containing protein [Burkholderiaceae bacterium]
MEAGRELTSHEHHDFELRFGGVQLDVEQRRLRIDGQPAKIGARAFDVIVALVERRQRAVGKNELFELVWLDVVVEENNLQVHISALRKLLGTSAPSASCCASIRTCQSSAPAASVRRDWRWRLRLCSANTFLMAYGRSVAGDARLLEQLAPGR